MTNDFQKWLIDQDYYRDEVEIWSKDYKEVSGAEMSRLLDEFYKTKTEPSHTQ